MIFFFNWNDDGVRVWCVWFDSALIDSPCDCCICRLLFIGHMVSALISLISLMILLSLSLSFFFLKVLIVLSHWLLRYGGKESTSLMNCFITETNWKDFELIHCYVEGWKRKKGEKPLVSLAWLHLPVDEVIFPS